MTTGFLSHPLRTLRITGLALLTTSIAMLGSLRAQDFAFRTFGEGQVPKVGEPHGLLQDSRGVIWMWGSRGITYYNGTSFHHLSTENGLPSNYCYTIHEARDGNLYFSTYNGLVRYTPETGKFETILTHPTSPIRDALIFDNGIYTATDGGVMFNDARGGFLIASLWDSPDSVIASNYLVQKLAYDSLHHVIWASTDRFGLLEIDIDQLPPLLEIDPAYASPGRIHRSPYVFVPDRIHPVDPVSAYAIKDSVERIARWRKVAKLHVLDKQQSSWSIEGVLFDQRTNSPIVWDHVNAYRYTNGTFTQLTHFDIPSSLNSVSLLPGGGFGYSRGDGLYIEKNGKVQRFSYDNGLPTRDIMVHLVDKQGIQWLLDRNSDLHRLANTALRLYDAPRIPMLRDLRGIVKLEDGSFMIGSDLGISHLTDSKLKTVLTFKNLESEFLNFGVDRNGNFLIATASRLYLYDTHTRNLRSLTSSHPANNGIVDFARAPDGNLWFVIFDRLYRWDGQTLMRNPGDELIGTLFVDVPVEGRILVGKWPWLNDYHHGVMRHYARDYFSEYGPAPIPSPTPPPPIRKIDVPSGRIIDGFAAKCGALGPDSCFWAGTFNAGVIRVKWYDDLQETLDSLRVYDDRSGLPSRAVSTVNRDNQGNLYFSLSEGVFTVMRDSVAVIRPQLPAGTVLFDFIRDNAGRDISATSQGLFVEDGNHRYIIDRTSGLINNAVKQLAFLPSGELLAIQPDGFFTIQLDSLIEGVTTGDPPIISSIWVDSLRVPTDRPVIVTTARRSFRCNLALPDYFNEQTHRYSWKLTGFDDRFRPFSTQHQVEYTNLPPGQFVLHVRALNGLGAIRNLVEPLTIVVVPRFFETRLFYILLVIFVALIFYLLMRFWTHRQQIKQERILQSEKEKLQVANRLAASIAHEFNNPLQIILGSYELVHHEDLDDEVRRSYLERIPLQVERMKNLIVKLLSIRNIREMDYAAGMKILDIHSPQTKQEGAGPESSVTPGEPEKGKTDPPK